MKTILNVIIGLALLTSCQGQKETLELNLTKGETYNQEMKTNTSVLQTFNGQQVNMNMSIDATIAYKVTDIQNDVYDMEVRYEKMEMKMTHPYAGEIQFSSEKNDESDIFSTLLGVLINKPFLVKMSKTGKINEVIQIKMLILNQMVCL